MPLTDADNARLYSDAFQRNTAEMLGQQAFAFSDLKSQLDVARAQLGVAQDELAASQKEAEGAKSDAHAFRELAIAEFAKGAGVETERVSVDPVTRAFIILDAAEADNHSDA